MSLNWNMKEVRDREALFIKVVDTEDGGRRYPTPEDKPLDIYQVLNPVSEGLIWLLIPICMGDITEENWSEVYHRIRIYEIYSGPAFGRKLGGVTPEIVKRHVGLKTNVHTSLRDWHANLKRFEKEYPAKAEGEWAWLR